MIGTVTMHEATKAYPELFTQDYAPVAWGCVTRCRNGMHEMLVGTRYKKGDNLRKGQLIIPGGHIDEGEDSYSAAVREVKEETGIDAERDSTFEMPCMTVIKPR